MRLVTDTNGTDVSLNTFHGQDDWHLTADQSEIDAIWDHPKSYRKPFTLKPPAIDDTLADAVLESIAGQLQKSLMKPLGRRLLLKSIPNSAQMW